MSKSKRFYRKNDITSTFFSTTPNASNPVKLYNAKASCLANQT